MLCRGCLLIALSLVLAQAAPSGPAKPAAVAAAAAHLDHAMSVLLSATSADDDVRTGLASLLDAVTDAVPPSTTIGVACGANMAVARWEFAHGSMFDQSATALVEGCYREMYQDARFQVPADVRTPQDARAFIGKQLSLARQLLLQDQPTDAVRPLIETIVFIMTPIQA